MANHHNSSHPLNLRKVIRAESDGHNWRVGILQTLLVIIWHWNVPTLTLSLAAWDWSTNAPLHWSMREDPMLNSGVFLDFYRTAWAARAMLALVLSECLFGFIVFRIVTRKQKPPVGAFLQCWWLTCLWGTIGVPVGVFLLVDMLTTPPAISVASVIGLLIAIIVPSLIFRSDLRSGRYRRCATCGLRFDRSSSTRCTSCGQELQTPLMRINRWRPVCPECGYSLKKLMGTRCPECGGAFPTDRKSFRRWAFHRLPWDRSDRGYLPTVYLKSIVCILFMPNRAARSLTIPDRWNRGIRWAVFHLVLAVLVVVLVSNYQYYVRYVISRNWPELITMPSNDMRFFDSPNRVIVWGTQTVIAWTIKFFVMVVIASCISFVSVR